MKHLLLFSSPGIWPMLEYEIDIIQRAIDDNYSVTFLQCKGGFNSCVANKETPTDLFNHFKCIRCKSRVKNGLNLIKNQSSLNIVEFPIINQNIIELQKKLRYEFNKSYLDFKKIQNIVDVENIDIYDSAISTLMSSLNDSMPNLESHRTLFYNYLLEGLNSYYSFKKVLNECNFDKIIIFNGRISRYRPALRVAQKLNLNVFLLEYPEFDFSTYALTPKNYSHDFNHRSKILREIADNKSEFSYELKIKIGRQIIEDSLNQIHDKHGTFISSEFVKLQHKNTLPESWNKSKFNIVFFTSSDFEMAGIPEYMSKLPEGSQAESIKKIRSYLDNDTYSLTVRVHPNQKNKDLKAANNLYQIETIGLNVIKASSNIDSYTLLKEADLIITFGSFLSVESAFLGKFVIVLGSNIYSSFKFCQTCYSVNNVIELIFKLKNNDSSDFLDLNSRIEEACLHMYARKNDGVKPIYLQRNTYTGGKININGTEIEILPSKSIYVFTKYFGLPIVLYNLYKSKGLKDVLLSIYKNIFKFKK